MLSPVRDVEDVLITGALAGRPTMAMTSQRETHALRNLAAVMADHPSEILPRFVDFAMDLSDGVAAGLSLYEPGPDGGVFRWCYLHGMMRRFEGTTTPRHFSPCGVTLDSRKPTLCAYPERYYSWIAEAGVTVPELLLVPLYLGNDSPFGTLWVLADQSEHFNAGHVEALVEIACFVSVALRLKAFSPTRAPRVSIEKENGSGALLRRLARFETLDAADHTALSEASTGCTAIRRGETIPSKPGVTQAVKSGFLGECRSFQDGHVQIVRLYVAGDMLPSPEVTQLDLLALSDVTIVEWPQAALVTVERERPAIARALNCTRVLGEATFYRWVATLGGRGATVRLAHLLYDLYLRLHDVGLASPEGYMLPLTQQHLASICGLSLVHTNKTLRNGLAKSARIKNGRVEIADLEALRREAEFDLQTT